MLTAGPRYHFPFCLWPFEGTLFFFLIGIILYYLFFFKGRTIASKGKKKVSKVYPLRHPVRFVQYTWLFFWNQRVGPHCLRPTTPALPALTKWPHNTNAGDSVTSQHSSQRVQCWADRGGCISWDWISVLAKWVVFPQSYLYFKSNCSLNSVPPPVVRIGYLEPQKWVLNVSVVRL